MRKDLNRQEATGLKHMVRVTMEGIPKQLSAMKVYNNCIDYNTDIVLRRFSTDFTKAINSMFR
jgi:hypothetical protein